MLPPAHRCSAVSSDTVPQAVAALPAKVGRSASFSSHSATRPSGQNLHQHTLDTRTCIDGDHTWLSCQPSFPAHAGHTSGRRVLQSETTGDPLTLGSKRQALAIGYKNHYGREGAPERIAEG